MALVGSRTTVHTSWLNEQLGRYFTEIQKGFNDKHKTVTTTNTIPSLNAVKALCGMKRQKINPHIYEENSSMNWGDGKLEAKHAELVRAHMKIISVIRIRDDIQKLHLRATPQ